MKACLAGVIAALLLSSALLADWQASSFKIHVRKPADKVELIAAGKDMTINVVSSDGIGSATITRTGEKWPERITVRLNLRSLEFVRLSNGTINLHSRLGGEAWTQGPQENHVVQATIRKAGASIEADVPDVLLRDNPDKLLIEWIDAYRR